MDDTDTVEQSAVEAYYGTTGRLLGFRVKLWHHGLNEFRVIKARDQGTLAAKCAAQRSKWAAKWGRESAKDAAKRQTQAAQGALHAARSILANGIANETGVSWAELARVPPFQFVTTLDAEGINLSDTDGKPLGIVPESRAAKPTLEADGTGAVMALVGKLFPPVRRHRVERLDAALARWRVNVAAADRREQGRAGRFERISAEYARCLRSYESDKAAHEADVAEFKQGWQTGVGESVERYAEELLDSLNWPDWAQMQFAVAYDPAQKILIVDQDLPTRGDIPTVKAIGYVAARDEVIRKELSVADQKRLYDLVQYQIVLRVLHALFASDDPGNLQLVTVNGWVTDTNPATGVTERKCILSVQAGKEEFGKLDLAHVEPKACFRALKGVSASVLYDMAPVTPILQFDRNDARFNAARSVTGGVDSRTNLAAMDWEDFEHLVREIFAKHFARYDAKVEVTRASRDWGVDAIVFDPDPIRGGKIVIQAKRYTNTVDVSAVRDLYGTVINEGAIKGVLITTSQYGPEAYQFAKDKPLSLLSGSNLLHLMEELGYKARINIEEAKRIAKERQGN